MKNCFELEGSVLAAWLSKKGGLAVKLAVTYEHKLGEEKIVLESVFLVVFTEKKKALSLDVAQGDIVKVTGYVHLEHRLSTGGNAHQAVMLIGDELEVLQKARWRENVDD